MEEFADMAVEEFRLSIDTEAQLLAEEHLFRDKIESWDPILMHLDELVAEEQKEFHASSMQINEKILEIQSLLESGELAGLRFVAEESKLLSKLKDDVKHRNWQAVKQDISDGSKKQEAEI